jgi:hypothetical protein
VTRQNVGELGTIHGRELTVDENTTLFFTGVVHRDTRIRWSMARFGGGTFASIGWEDPNHATIIENLYTLTIQPASGGGVATTIRLPASQDTSANSASDVRQHAGGGRPACQAQGCWALAAIGRLVYHPWVWAEQFGRLLPA